MQIEVTLGQLVVALGTFIIVYTVTVVGLVSWLNGKFSALLPMRDYQKAHEDLIKDVRELQKWMWTTKKNGPAT